MKEEPEPTLEATGFNSRAATIAAIRKVDRLVDERKSLDFNLGKALVEAGIRPDVLHCISMEARWNLAQAMGEGVADQ